MARFHIDSPSPEDISQIVAAIDGLSSIEEAEDRLEALIPAYFTHPEAAQHLRVWFRLFERFPEDDNHYFWQLLHGLEHRADSSPLVVESVRRRPSGVPLRMVNRMLNAGITPIVPRYGSVGASGDLMPSAYLARVLVGEGEAELSGRRMSATDALRAAGLAPMPTRSVPRWPS